ncbi:hypothetical protein Hs30E_19470 [Lactococcus hodotermopsidis]|uniref:Uncharacterized protein n=1 Tax=Pseudolactococcus hodotermopsidis TaxID=2709157 RepID=A0A6A0BF43_9LACT|nr:hypothetical protein [Lactococcus hodotermopsidis]GFH43396.1 hypothetical protein Hs30E_19470 [Lactococcus hodotermopsidis]
MSGNKILSSLGTPISVGTPKTDNNFYQDTRDTVISLTEKVKSLEKSLSEEKEARIKLSDKVDDIIKSHHQDIMWYIGIIVTIVLAFFFNN